MWIRQELRGMRFLLVFVSSLALSGAMGCEEVGLLSHGTTGSHPRPPLTGEQPTHDPSDPFSISRDQIHKLEHDLAASEREILEQKQRLADRLRETGMTPADVSPQLELTDPIALQHIRFIRQLERRVNEIKTHLPAVRRRLAEVELSSRAATLGIKPTDSAMDALAQELDGSQPATPEWELVRQAFAQGQHSPPHSVTHDRSEPPTQQRQAAQEERNDSATRHPNVESRTLPHQEPRQVNHTSRGAGHAPRSGAGFGFTRHLEPAPAATGSPNSVSPQQRPVTPAPRYQPTRPASQSSVLPSRPAMERVQRFTLDEDVSVPLPGGAYLTLLDDNTGSSSCKVHITGMPYVMKIRAGIPVHVQIGNQTVVITAVATDLPGDRVLFELRSR